MTERREICLDQNDTIAAAQVLAWIARPHRPESGVRLLNEWWLALERQRGEDISDAPFSVDKPNRLQVRMRAFSKDLHNAFLAGVWLEWMMLADMGKRGRWLKGAASQSIRKRAAVYESHRRGNLIDSRDYLVGNTKRAIWLKRKPVVHMCLAAAQGIGPIIGERRKAGTLPVNIFELYMRPTWLAEALNRAEECAEIAQRIGIVTNPDPIRFYR